ncbi:5761_t:CDS:1 [Diversispora eburnea]|uniref:5761_t:CDS:1 n=1 Tax=Diversispora eburnea TaxID=1213867 RepID=A0A9N8V5L9_9GLOM|nr:5761_t:CDS:1 [Diversispora eburnea]
MAEILAKNQLNQLNREFVVTQIDLIPVISKSSKSPCIFTIDNVCTPEECAALIEYSEKEGVYEQALINVGNGQQKLMSNIRNNTRYMKDDKQLASMLWSRIKNLVPNTWSKDKFPSVGLNERLRFLRYDPGEWFKPHQDGNYQQPDGSETSFVTLQLYLNEGFVGGETTFLDFTGEKKVKVTPKTGSVLIFEHRLCHEGSEVVSGRKYVIRTDVMYKTDKYRKSQ